MTVFDLIADTAGRYGVPLELASAVAWQESRYNQDARGAAGEVGMFQLMPGTAADLGVNPYDLRQNVEGGIRYLREQFERFGDWTTALIAYNAGPGNVSRGTVPRASRDYASSVLARVGANPATRTQAPATPATRAGGVWMLPALRPPNGIHEDHLPVVAVILAGLAILAALSARR